MRFGVHVSLCASGPICFAISPVDPAVTMMPDFSDRVKRVRWHPHVTGALVAPLHDLLKTQEAYQKFQEISGRPSHQLTVKFGPGDM